MNTDNVINDIGTPFFTRHYTEQASIVKTLLNDKSERQVAKELRISKTEVNRLSQISNMDEATKTLAIKCNLEKYVILDLMRFPVKIQEIIKSEAIAGRIKCRYDLRAFCKRNNFTYSVKLTPKSSFASKVDWIFKNSHDFSDPRLSRGETPIGNHTKFYFWGKGYSAMIDIQEGVMTEYLFCKHHDKIDVHAFYNANNFVNFIINHTFVH